MAFIPTPNGMSLCFHFTQSGQNWQFCLTLQKTAGAPTNTDLTNAAGTGQSWFAATLGPLMGNSVTCVDCTATDLTVQGGPQVIQPVNVAGSGGSQHWAQSSALVVSQRTALRGRSYRGRAYLGGLLYPNVLNDVDYQSSPAIAIASAFQTLATSLNGLGYKVIVASGQHNKVVTSPKVTHEVIAYIVDAHLDSQRRRLFGRGK